MSRERIRSLKPEFFRDERIKALSRDARLVAIGIVTRSDDRGRQAYEVQALLGHIFPGGDVTPRQLVKWVGEVVAGGFTRLYTSGPFEYLWLPNFWRHQVINRPTESSYPPHPDELFVDMPIGAAIKAYRKKFLPDQSVTNSGTNSMSDSVSGSDPHAQARTPLPSVVAVVDVEGTNAITRACTILESVWPHVDPVGVENVAAMHPETDLVAAARKAAVWGSSPDWDRGAAATLLSVIDNQRKNAAGGRSKAERQTAGLAAFANLERQSA